jgi:hypothetical protein
MLKKLLVAVALLGFAGVAVACETEPCRSDAPAPVLAKKAKAAKKKPVAGCEGDCREAKPKPVKLACDGGDCRETKPVKVKLACDTDPCVQSMPEPVKIVRR